MSTTVIDTTKTGWAVSERGKRTRYTELEVETALKLLVANGGSCTRTSDQLRSENINISRQALETWRDHAFPHRYLQLRTEMSPEVAERIAANAMDRAMEADRATQVYIEKAAEKADFVDPDHLAKNALALAQVMGTNVEKAQLLRDRPTEIIKVDLSESIGVLERLGVIEKTEVIDAEVIEE